MSSVFIIYIERIPFTDLNQNHSHNQMEMVLVLWSFEMVFFCSQCFKEIKEKLRLIWLIHCLYVKVFICFKQNQHVDCFFITFYFILKAVGCNKKINVVMYCCTHIKVVLILTFLLFMMLSHAIKKMWFALRCGKLLEIWLYLQKIKTQKNIIQCRIFTGPRSIMTHLHCVYLTFYVHERNSF